MGEELKRDIIKDMEMIISKMSNGYHVKLNNIVDKIYYYKYVMTGSTFIMPSIIGNDSFIDINALIRKQHLQESIEINISTDTINIL